MPMSRTPSECLADSGSRGTAVRPEVPTELARGRQRRDGAASPAARSLYGVHMGPVEQAIRATVSAGDQLRTPTGRGAFRVQEVRERGVTLLLGAKQTPTFFTWHCLEGIPAFLATGAWVRVGSRYDTAAEAGTLDDYLKRHVNRATAGWVAALLERAGIIDLDRTSPARVRLRTGATEKAAARPERAPERTGGAGTFVCATCGLRRANSQRSAGGVCADCA